MQAGSEQVGKLDWTSVNRNSAINIIKVYYDINFNI
jgi:hypothetical protein